MRNQKGFVEEFAIFIIVAAVFALIIGAIFVRWQPSNDVVSGIVYNTSSDNWPNGTTNFSVRAAVDTIVTEENQSSFCLPKDSPYIPLIRKAAEDKNVKVVVSTNKYFAIQAPWVCSPNVTVTEAK